MDGVIALDEARRIRGATIRVVVAANFVAAVVMFCLLNLLNIGSSDDLRTSVLSFVATSAMAFTGGIALGRRLFRPVDRWAGEGRPPTAAEAAVVVNGPRIVAAIALGFWLVTALAIGVAEVVDSGRTLAGVRAGLVLVAAGVTSAALSYLLVERRARPLVAAALAGRAPERSASLGLWPRLLLSWALGSGVPLLAIVIGEWSVAESDPRMSAAAAIFVACVGLAVGAAMSVAATRSIADPIAAVREALAAVERGDLSVAVVVDDTGEIGRLQAGVNRMVAGLRERQVLADLFGRHVGTEVAQRAVRDGVRLGGERRQASALFADLRDSTQLAAGAPPEEVVTVLNGFFAEVVRIVSAEGGWVNKFEGDGAMCIFGVPVGEPDHAARALRAARRLQTSLRDAGLSAAIGVSSGEVVAGNVGTEERLEYTVIGDAVNEASRLTDAAKDTPGNLLASGVAVERAGSEAARWEPVTELQLRGRAGPTTAFAPVNQPAR